MIAGNGFPVWPACWALFGVERERERETPLTLSLTLALEHSFLLIDHYGYPHC